MDYPMFIGFVMIWLLTDSFMNIHAKLHPL